MTMTDPTYWAHRGGKVVHVDKSCSMVDGFMFPIGTWTVDCGALRVCSRCGD